MNKFYKPADVMSVVDMFFTVNVCNEFHFCISKYWNVKLLPRSRTSHKSTSDTQIMLQASTPKIVLALGFPVFTVYVIGAEHNCYQINCRLSIIPGIYLFG